MSERVLTAEAVAAIRERAETSAKKAESWTGASGSGGRAVRPGCGVCGTDVPVLLASHEALRALAAELANVASTLDETEVWDDDATEQQQLTREWAEGILAKARTAGFLA